MISLAEAWFFAMREFGLGPNLCNPFPSDPRCPSETDLAEKALHDMLMRGDIPCSHGGGGAIPASARRRGYRLWFHDNAMVPTGSVPGLPVLEDVRVCEETLSRRIAGICTPAVPRAEEKRRRKGGRRPVADWAALKAEAIRLMEYHGNFIPGDRAWNAQARLETALLKFSKTRFGIEPAPSTLREKIGPWLCEWKMARN
jgi:hypothetical protein